MSTNPSRVRALRGATTVPNNDARAIVDATRELLEELFARNEVEREDLVSLIFTTTPDLTANFPAAAAREMGLSDVPLLCASEIAVDGAVPGVGGGLVALFTPRD